MKKRILSLSIVLALVLTLGVPAMAAGKTETLSINVYASQNASYGDVSLTFTNFLSMEVKDFSIELSDESFNPEGVNATVIYCDVGAKMTLNSAVNYLHVYWDGNLIPAEYGPTFVWKFYEGWSEIGIDTSVKYDVEPDSEDGYSLADGTSVTFNKAGEYAVMIEPNINGPDWFFVIVGNGASVTPAAAVPASGSTAKLKTTDGLNSVVPPAPVVVTSDVPHKVGKGESLAAIAKKYGTTVEKIKADNKAYFDDLAARNKKQGTSVGLEAGVTLTVKSVKETKPLAYTVQKGENLWGIAYNYYGTMSGAKVMEIKEANKAYFDDLAARNKKQGTSVPLEAGAVLVLPAKGLTAPVTQSTVSTAAGTYLVKSGDTLGAIAKVYYGDTGAWKKIYEANKDTVKLVGGSPMIYTGQWLVIPE